MRREMKRKKSMRLPPPRLLGPEEQSAVDEAVVEAVATPAPAAKAESVARELLQESTEPEVVPPAEVPAALESKPIPAGANAGGGVRLPPPPLLAPGDGQTPEDAALEARAEALLAMLGAREPPLRRARAAKLLERAGFLCATVAPPPPSFLPSPKGKQPN